MKTYKIIKSIFLATLISIFSTVTIAGTNAQNLDYVNFIQIKKYLVQQIGKDIYLRDIINKITSISGIKFKVNTDISDVKVTHIISADNLYDTIKSLLIGYNWVAINNKESLITVIIINKNSGYLTAGDRSITRNMTNSGVSDTENTEGKLVIGYLHDDGSFSPIQNQGAYQSNLIQNTSSWQRSPREYPE